MTESGIQSVSAEEIRRPAVNFLSGKVVTPHFTEHAMSLPPSFIASPIVHSAVARKPELTESMTSLEEYKKKLVGFIGLMSTMARFTEDYSSLPDSLMSVRLGYADFKESEITDETSRAKDFHDNVISSNRAAMQAGQETINAMLWHIGGLQCNLTLPGTEEARLYTLSKWNAVDKQGRMLWGIKEQQSDEGFPIDGPTLITELRTLHS